MVDGKLSSSLVLCMEILAGCDRVSCEERLYGGFQKLEKWPQGEVGMRGGSGTFLFGGGSRLTSLIWRFSPLGSESLVTAL